MSNRNAKEEFLNVTENYNVIAANISFGQYDYEECYKLKPLYTEEEYNDFLNFLDRQYYAGYGGQELFGVIYCENGVWMQRGEYDGSEWWDIFQYPDLRDSFDEADVVKYERYLKLKNIEENKNQF